MGEEPFLNWNAPPIVLNDGAQPGRPAAADRGAAHAGQSWTCGWCSTAPPSATGSARAASRAASGRGRGREDRGADQGRAAADQQPQGRLSDRVDEKTTVMTVRKIPHRRIDPVRKSPRVMSGSFAQGIAAKRRAKTTDAEYLCTFSPARCGVFFPKTQLRLRPALGRPFRPHSRSRGVSRIPPPLLLAIRACLGYTKQHGQDLEARTPPIPPASRR